MSAPNADPTASTERRPHGISQRAWLPLALSAFTGLAVLVAIGYVWQRAGLWQSLFAVSVFALWLYGFYRTWHILARYGEEEAALSQAQEKLNLLAKSILPRQIGAVPELPNTPLLQRRVADTLRAIQRGASLSGGELVESEERKLSAPERELRTYMDIALNVGIAGTFVSILVTLGQPQGLTADTLLAHVGPGMTSGFAAVVANIGLRLCHRAVQDEQDILAQQVEDTVADSLLAHIEPSALSPEERLAASAAAALVAQSAATQQTLADQSAIFENLLERYAVRIGQILTQQVQNPIQQLANHTGILSGHVGKLAQHSGTWAETASDLKAAHVVFLQRQEEAQRLHEERGTLLFTRYRTSLDEFLTETRLANQKTQQETLLVVQSLLATHTQAMTAMMERFDAHVTTLLAEQAEAHRRLTESALAALSRAVETQFAAMEGRMAEAFTALEGRLPEALRSGVHGGLSETVALMEAVREQTAGLAHAIAQISGNADRQLLAYERWHDRAMAVQGRLEQVVADGQSAQAELLAHWRTEATQTLDTVHAAFGQTIREAQSGASAITHSLERLVQTLQSLQDTMQNLHKSLDTLPNQVEQTRSLLHETLPSLRDVDTVCRDIQTVLEALRASTAVLLENAQEAKRDAEEQSTQSAMNLQRLADTISSATTQMEQAATTFAVVATKASAPTDGPPPVAPAETLPDNTLPVSLQDTCS